MGRFDNIRSRLAELIDESRDEEPEPEGYQGDERASGLIRGSVLEHDPDRDDLNYYRQLYENVGPIKSAVDNYSSEVIEPGWYITADSDETAEQLTEYFKNVAILNTETDVNASVLMETMVREREIRGTVFLEKVTDSEDRNQAIYPLQNDTITIYTKPGKSMLPAPDGDRASIFDDAPRERDEPPRKSDGRLGAYVQFDDIKPKWSGTEEVVYTRDEILKWTRDADIGDPRGTARLASSARRAEGLLEKLEDNDDAVKFKAWPQIIFELGDEDNPWNEDEVMDFIEHYEEGQMSPGMMQAVAGDVNVEEFAGETADISETLDFDISMVMSGLPGPVYATGGFSQNVAPAVAQQQQRQFIKEVKKTRRELENIFTPYLTEVAEDYDLDAADSVELHLGNPPGHIPPEDIEGSIIRYTSDVQQGEGVTDEEGEGAAAAQPGDTTGSPSTGSPNQAGDPPNASQTKGTETESSLSSRSMEADTFHSFRGHQYGHTEESVESEALSDNGVQWTTELERAGRVDEFEYDELADPRIVSTREIETELESLLAQELLSVRESLLTTLENTEDRPVQQPEELEGAATRAVESATEDARIDPRSRTHFEDTIEKTLDTLGQDNHTPTMDVEFSTRHRQRSRFLSDNMADSFQNVADEMLREAKVHIRQAVQHGEEPSVVAERLRNSITEDDMRNRAQAMSRLEIKSAVNSLKLAEYDRDSDIVGIRLVNPCNENTTPLCDALACDDQSEAMFDADVSTAEQFSEDVSDRLMFDGFDPLPTVPPFHFNCRTEIVAVTE